MPSEELAKYVPEEKKPSSPHLELVEGGRSGNYKKLEQHKLIYREDKLDKLAFLADKGAIEIDSQGQVIVDPENFIKFKFTAGRSYSERKELGTHVGRKQSQLKSVLENIFQEIPV